MYFNHLYFVNFLSNWCCFLYLYLLYLSNNSGCDLKHTDNVFGFFEGYSDNCHTMSIWCVHKTHHTPWLWYKIQGNFNYIIHDIPFFKLTVQFALIFSGSNINCCDTLKRDQNNRLLSQKELPVPFFTWYLVCYHNSPGTLFVTVIHLVHWLLP